MELLIMKWRVRFYILEVFIILQIVQQIEFNWQRRWNHIEKNFNFVDKILFAIIKFYRKYLSPMKTTKCPYFPTCSEYGLQAVEKYGAVKGGILAAWRILRCNPFSKGGYDPVP